MPSRRRRRAPTADRPTADLGHHVRIHRKAAGITHVELAEKTGMRAPQISLLETGHNVEARQYGLIARALGFRTALEMFQAQTTDPLDRHLLRAWSLLDADLRKRALRWLNQLLIEG